MKGESKCYFFNFSFLSLRSRSVWFRFKNGSLLPVVTRSESAIKGRGGGDVSLPIISIWLTSSLTLGLTCGFRRRQEAPYYLLLEFIILFSFFFSLMTGCLCGNICSYLKVNNPVIIPRIRNEKTRISWGGVLGGGRGGDMSLRALSYIWIRQAAFKCIRTFFSSF